MAAELADKPGDWGRTGSWPQCLWEARESRQEVSLQRGTGKAEGHGPVRFPSRPPSGTTVAEMFVSAGFQELLNPFQETGLRSPNAESKQVLVASDMHWLIPEQLLMSTVCFENWGRVVRQAL